MNADIVNLNRFKKRKARAEKQAQAAENRTKHGRTKGEKARDAKDAADHERLLDGLKKDGEPPDQP
jgi:hypothetical protein